MHRARMMAATPCIFNRLNPPKPRLSIYGNLAQNFLSGMILLMGTRSATDIDAHVGARIRLRRMLIGMSQERLGDALGVTFQQIQKYERGANRISASKLYEVSRVLGVAVSHFMDGLEGGQAGKAKAAAAVLPDGAENIMDFVRSPEGLSLNRAFAAITNPKKKRAVLDLVKLMAERDD